MIVRPLRFAAKRFIRSMLEGSGSTCMVNSAVRPKLSIAVKINVSVNGKAPFFGTIEATTAPLFASQPETHAKHCLSQTVRMKNQSIWIQGPLCALCSSEAA